MFSDETASKMRALRFGLLQGLSRANEFESMGLMFKEDRFELYGDRSQEILARGTLLANVRAFGAISTFLAGVAALASDVEGVDGLLGAVSDEVDGASEFADFLAVCRAFEVGCGASADRDVAQGFFECLALRLHDSSSLVGGGHDDSTPSCSGCTCHTTKEEPSTEDAAAKGSCGCLDGKGIA